MNVYGVGLLAGCFILGQLMGESLGNLLHVEANVGGVAFSMIFLILCLEWLRKTKKITQPVQEGIGFWSEMYIPIIVAMAATQNVRGAFEGGGIALLAGIIPTIGLIFFVPWISRLTKIKNDD